MSRTTSDHSQPGNFILQTDGTLVQGDEAFYALLGGNKHKRFPDVFLCFSEAILALFGGDMAMGRTLLSSELQFVDAEDLVHDCLVNAFVKPHPQNESLCIYGSLTPYQANRRSLLEDDIMRAAYQTPELRIWVIDVNQKILRYNKAFAQHIKQHLEKDLKNLSSAEDIIPPNYHLTFSNLLKNIRQGISQTLEVRFKPGQNLEFWSELTMSPLQRNQEVFACLIIEKDISQRKLSDNLVADLSLVANKTDNSVIITDSNRRIEWVNDGFRKLTGYSLPEVAGQRPRTLLYGELTDPHFLQKMDDAVAKGEAFSGEAIKYRKNGTHFWVHMNLNPVFDEEGRIVKYVVVENEITRRKEMEEQLVKAREEALRLSQEKEQFLSVVTHELRNPLNALIGLTQLLMQRSPREDQLELLENIKFSEDNLLTLINDILDFSKIEAGKITFEKTEYNLGELVGGIARMYAHTAGQKGVELFSVVEPDVPNLVSGDPVRLNQIITNLVSNAIKFTDQRGYVKLRVSVLNKVRDKAELLFEVEDTGIGIPSERVDYIFEKYQQASKSTTRTHGGTGLGLAITRQLVELQGGEISVDSKVNKGSRFFFNLPVDIVDEKAHKQRQEVIDEELMPFESVRVLLAEDNRINLLVASEFLQQWNIEVDGANNGMEALELAQGATYDLVLMDLQMPVMDGFDAIAKIRSLGTYAETPIIALTGFSDDASGRLDRSLIDGMLTKPFSPKQLHGMIQRFCVDKIHLEGRKLIQEGETLEPADQEQINLDSLFAIAKGDQGFLDQVLDLYDKQFSRVPKQLRDALHFNEWHTIRQILHKINPSLHLLQNQKVINTITDIRQAIHDDADKAIIEQKINYLLLLIEKLEKLLKQKVDEMRQPRPH